MPIKVGQVTDPLVKALISHDDPERVYQLGIEIGHGNFGVVYHANHVETGAIVAIKKMSFNGKDKLDKWNDIMKEIMMMAQLQHPHCVSILTCFVREYYVWLAMEYCLGSAADILDVNKSALSEFEVSAICNETLRALTYLHNLSFIHRDVKAGNILLTSNGVAKLADFGTASLVPRANSFVGSPFWMSPELIMAMEEGEYDNKVDSWSLGITAIELVELQPPLFAMNAMAALYHIAQNEPPTLKDPSIWSPSLVEFVNRCLVKKTDDRASCEELSSDPFVTQTADRTHEILYQMVRRTQQQVRQLDRQQIGRLKKILLPTSAVDMDEPEVEDDPHMSVSQNGSVRDGFATIRPQQLVRREEQQVAQDHVWREHMANYKRLRKQNKKETKLLEEKLKTEMETVKQKMDREYDETMTQIRRELARLGQRHERQLEERLKSSEQQEKNRLKRLNARHAKEEKSFASQGKKDGKERLEAMKRQVAAAPHAKKDKELHVKQWKEQQTRQMEDDRRLLEKSHRDTRDFDTRVFRRRKILQFHALKEALVRQDMDTRLNQLELANNLLVRHHETIRVVELDQSQQVQRMRATQLQQQHGVETRNQQEFIQRTFATLRRKHVTEEKQQPKDIKRRTDEVQAQCKAALQTQEKQFRALKERITATAPKEEHKARLRKLQDERMVKLAQLAEQYEKSIQEMVMRHSTLMSNSRDDERSQVEAQIMTEREQLAAWQHAAFTSLKQQHQRETDDISQKIALRRAILENKMETETNQLRDERHKKLTSLAHEAAHQLAAFDTETARMGLDSASVVELSKQVDSDDDEISFSGSMMSLTSTASTAHSEPRF